MIKLNFIKQFQFRFKKSDDGKPMIFDIVRKKWLILTPEEWVRQHWVHNLIEVHKINPSVIVIEAGLKVYNTNKRSDIVVYKNGEPDILIECKRESVVIDDKVLQQAVNYNSNYQCNFLVISNGINHYYFKKENGELVQKEGL